MENELFRMEHITTLPWEGLALTDFQFSARLGEIHCLFCTSSRARSALYELINGFCPSASGRMYLCGKPLEEDHLKSGPFFALRYQREASELFPELTVADNLLGNHPELYSGGHLHDIQMFARAQEILFHHGISDIPVTAPLKTLSPFQQRMISILRDVCANVRILFLEDSLTQYNTKDIQNYVNLVRQIAAAGIAVILVTDRFNEFVSCSDHLSILQSGTIIYHTPTKGLSRDSLLRLIKSQELSSEAGMSAPRQSGEPLLLRDPLHVMKDISLFPDEILGIYDPDWKTGSRIQAAISALVSSHKLSPSDFAVISEEDSSHGIFRNMSLYENISLHSPIVFDRPLGLYNRQMDYYTVNHLLKSLQAGDLIEKYAHLSSLPRMGPNEQMMVVIARHLCSLSRAFVFINPYVGYNDRTIRQFHTTLKILLDSGHPSIIISRNERQLRQICTRIDY